MTGRYPEDVRIVDSASSKYGTSDWFRKLHIYLQRFWRAWRSWKKIKLAEDLGRCVECKQPIKPLDFYFCSSHLVWHEWCVEQVLIKKATETAFAS